MRRYNSTDKPIMNEWLKPYDMELGDHEWPEIGYIVPGVAMGLLFRMEGNTGFLDSFCTAPGSTKQDRIKALELITEALIQDAKILGLRRLYALTDNEGIKVRCTANGFTLDGSYMLFKKEIN